MDAIPNTLSYMLAGYAVLVGFPILYAVSLVWRRRRQAQELELLRELAKENQKRPGKS